MKLDFFTLFNRLISQPSVSSANPALDQSNMGVINLLAEIFEGLGFRCELIPVPGQCAKANLIATLGSGTGGLALAGHTDTVPFDEARWEVNPLQATAQDNRLYGLGAADMKGFFAIVHEVVQDFLEVELERPLILIATADEESTMAGARLLAELGRPKASCAIIGEPTSLRPVLQHKGVMMETIRVRGQSGHSSDPSLGNSALEAMHEVIGELIRFRKKLEAKYHNPLFQIAHPTMNLGVISGGDNPNRICGHCDLEFDLRLLPGMSSEALRADIAELTERIARQRQVAISVMPLIQSVAPFQNDSSELGEMAQQLTGHEPQSAAFATEAPFLQKLGMDAVILGPGSIDQAHQPNEYLALDQVRPCVKVLQSLIRRHCLSA